MTNDDPIKLGANQPTKAREYEPGPFLFRYLEPLCLADELCKPLANLYLTVYHQSWGQSAITLVPTDGTLVTIKAQMQDIEDRLEAGVLVFSLTSPLPQEGKTIEIPPAFGAPTLVTRLLLEESGKTAESGVAFRAADGAEIVIVAAGFPFAVTLGGDLPADHKFAPEYELHKYTRVAIG